MTAVYLRVGVWVVVVVGVVCSIVRPQIDSVSRNLVPLSANGSLPQTVREQTGVEDTSFVPISLFSFVSYSLTTPSPAPRVIPEESAPASSLTIAGLQQRKSVTFVMPHSPAAYFLQDGEQMGFEYELAEEFGRELGIRVDIVTAPPGSTAMSLLQEGKGDILAGVVTTEGMALDAIRTSRPYFETTAQVVTRSDSSAPRALDQLAGQFVALHSESAYAFQLQQVTRQHQLPSVFPVTVGEEGTRETLEAVLSEQTKATVLMTPLVRVAQAWYPGQLRSAWTLPQPVRLVWAVRPGQTALLQAINDYLARVSRSGVIKVLTEKYLQFSPSVRADTYLSGGSLSTPRRVSRYDRVIARHAEEAGFDWRFVAALIFEESRFDHKRVSSAGAYGLMQLMPFTAQLVGMKNYHDPHANIEAGVKYLRFLSRWFQDGRPQDRLALILASYVMGVGHVEDAQRIARMQGFDPDCWTGSMDQVLPLLEDPKYYNKTLYGYGQGTEAVRYANAILKRYELYSRYVTRDFPSEEVPVVPDSQAASAVAG